MPAPAMTGACTGLQLKNGLAGRKDWIEWKSAKLARKAGAHVYVTQSFVKMVAAR